MQGNQIRDFNFIQGSDTSLAKNTDFEFARRHSLCLYKQKAIYTFIPKNACTTLRTSISIANGALQPDILDNDQLNWIHSNSYTFSADLSQLATAKYTFTILRCPYDRLVSLFLDKFVDKTKVALDFYKKSNNLHDPDAITFTQFIQYLKNTPKILNANIHWQRQSDFLVYTRYDDYFDFSDFTHIENTLKRKIGLKLFDTRALTNHGRDKTKEIKDSLDYSNVPVLKLKELKDSGYVPCNKNMLTQEIENSIKLLYNTDLTLKKKKCKKRP